jgi:hypothetical protein
LSAILMKEHSNRLLGLIFFQAGSGAWQEELGRIINELSGRYG